ncbi:MAG: hypothetical protein R3D62_04640 [Xanthobacteraceae bacterium]
MGRLAISLVALTMILGYQTDGPSEVAMESAFAARLKQDMGHALDLASEIGGARAVARIRETGMDRFAIRSFTKLACNRPTQVAGYVCRFAVDIETAGGSARRTLTGRFVPAAGALTFAQKMM